MNKIAETLANSITLSTNEKLAMINLSGGGLSAGNPLSNFLRRNIKNPINNYMFSSGIKDPFASLNSMKQYLSSNPRIGGMYQNLHASRPDTAVNDHLNSLMQMIRGR